MVEDVFEVDAIKRQYKTERCSKLDGSGEELWYTEKNMDRKIGQISEAQ